MIYFDNSATTGVKPREVIVSVNKALTSLSANPGRSGHNKAIAAAEAIFKARENVADFFSADGAEQVIFTPGCTSAINYVLKGVLKRGDHVIVSSLEHNAVMRPIHSMGIDYSVAEVSLYDDEITLKNFEALIRENTKMIFCTGASNVIGKILPLEAIGRLAKKYKIFFSVDAAQIAGLIEIDMKKFNIDYLCVAGHKGLYAPMGVGVLIARAPILKTVIEGGTGSNSKSLKNGTDIPEDFESGTVNLPGILGLSAGIDFVRKKGIKNIYTHEMRLITRLYNKLSKNKNIILYNKPEANNYVPLLSFNVKGFQSAKTAELLNKYNIAVRGGLHCAPSAHKVIGTLEDGTVRISPSLFNSEMEIDFLVRALWKIKNI